MNTQWNNRNILYGTDRFQWDWNIFYYAKFRLSFPLNRKLCIFVNSQILVSNNISKIDITVYYGSHFDNVSQPSIMEISAGWMITLVIYIIINIWSLNICEWYGELWKGIGRPNQFSVKIKTKVIIWSDITI